MILKSDGAARATTDMGAGRSFPLGATPDGDGVNFAVFSENASRVDLCLFSTDGAEETARLSLPERTGPIWHGHVRGLAAGAVYGYRVHGPYEPWDGHRFNANKLLLDPYARRLTGSWRHDPALLGYDPDESEPDLSFSHLDSAPCVPRAVVSAPLAPSATPKPRRPWAETVIYEAHPKGLTQQFPGLPDEVRGTYEALGRREVIDHLLALGVTAVELLPVHAFIDDGFLLEKGLTNYWGYNSIGFLAPEPRYFGPNGAEGFRDAIDRLHEAGIEVILDVVYNHTAEGDQRGPTLGFRGLDNAAYYRLEEDDARLYANDTGCGNMLDFRNPFVIRLTLDSLRFWAAEMGVDGFRFDLATVLGRRDDGFSARAAFFDALRQDPVLSAAKLIAEPWDIGPGGYQLGAFPPEFAEWSDGYRDDVRGFWRGDPHGARALAGRLLGSAETFDHRGRRPQASVNLLTAHDGFTLADLTSYSRRRNRANGESGHDGHAANYSDNCGAEGPTDDEAVNARRRRRRMNLLATLFLSQGAPMLLAGDEIGNSQGGNNNAYCQDNEIGWVNWADADEALLRFTRRLIALRRDHPVLRQTRFLHAMERADGAHDVSWSGFAGEPVDWEEEALPGFRLTLRCAAETPPEQEFDDASIIFINRAEESVTADLPDAPAGRIWRRELDTARPDAAPETASRSLRIDGHSVVALFAAPA